MAAWNDLEGLVELMRDQHPRVDPRGLDDDELRSLVETTEGFKANGEPLSGDLEALRAMWHWGV